MKFKVFSPNSIGNKTILRRRRVVPVFIILVAISGLLALGWGVGAQSILRIGSKSEKTDPAKGNKRPVIGSFDIRLNNPSVLNDLIARSSLAGGNRGVLEKAAANKADIEKAIDALKGARPNVTVEASILTGGIEVLKSTDGLTPPNRGKSGIAIVREFITDNPSLYGLSAQEVADLNFIGESISLGSGLRMVRVEQIVNGRPVFMSETRFILDRSGRIVSSLGAMAPNAAPGAEQLSGLLSPQDALKRTMERLHVTLDTASMEVVKTEEDGMRTEMRVSDPRIKGTVTSKIVYFAAAPGMLIPAWSQTVFSEKEDWYVLVDARDGAMLWRKNIRSGVSVHDARFRVYVQADGTTPADSPAPQSPSAALPGGGTQFAGIAPTIVSMHTAYDPVASPNGWINDCPGGICTAAETQTLGNNALACLDRDGAGNNICDTGANSVLDGNGRPTGNTDTNTRDRDFLGTAPRDFQTNFLPPPQGGNPEAGQTATGTGTAPNIFRRGSIVQQFYVANWYHDKLHALGFNEAAGNFQLTNFSGMGLGNDRVLVDVHDASSVDNANFSTPADGVSGRAQMFRFTGPTIDRDGGLDTEILIHELTHGTSNRLVGNGAGLQWGIGGALGEGWSDFYALSLLNNTNADDPNARYASAAYSTYKLAGLAYLDNYVYGIRRFPYSTDNSVNPLTWADTDQTTSSLTGGIAPTSITFDDGGANEVHNAGEIWGLTLWELRSRMIAAAAGSVPTGNQQAMQLVTDGMKMTPANPTFLQARDALVDTDCATNACGREQLIWDSFADRGLGYGAFAPTSITLGFVSGHTGVVESFNTPNLDVNTVTIADGIGNNSGFIDPNEPVRIVVNMKNPWRHTSKTATGITAVISSTTPGVTILSPSTTYPNIAPNGTAAKNGEDLVIKAPATACGGRLNFTLTITSSLGAIARNFSFRMGAPGGTLAPVTYTRSGLGLAIPDNQGKGVIDTLNITDDFEIADLNVRINSLTHAFVDDISFGVRGPSGYGADFLSFFGFDSADGGNGDNFVNTVIDDSSGNNMITEVAANAPFSNSYHAVFNSPSWPVIFGAGQDPVPQLSRFNGTSTLGDWKAMVSDQFGGDLGTLQGWSLIVTPRAFTCTAFVPTAASVGVSGRVIDAQGRAISRAVVSLTDNEGRTRTAKTNPFGFYAFDDVAAGQSYTFTASAKGYSFNPRIVTVGDEITGLDFVGTPE